MSEPSTAREALIVEALGSVALLLDRVELTTSSMETSRIALANASAELGDRVEKFEAGTASVARQIQVRAIEHILKRTGKATSDSIELQARAMSAAARMAFSEQVHAELARLNAELRRATEHLDRPWDVWLTHAATAAISAAVTGWAVTSFVIR